jgi:ABC-2 type transport system ATP-binding protein
MALLGPNGAGKTTLISIVAGLLHPDAGQVFVEGIDAVRDPFKASRHYGLAPQELGVYPTITVRANLSYFCQLSGLSGRERSRRVEEVAGAMGLSELLDRLPRNMSGGEKRRLHAAMAMVHRPKLLLLDEPTVGADIESRNQLLGVVRRLADEGTAVLYTTHYLHEVETLDARVTIIDRGRCVAAGEVRSLISTHAHPLVEFTFDGEPPDLPDVTSTRMGHALLVEADEPAKAIATVMSSLPETGRTVTSIEIVKPSLEAVFLAITGSRFGEGGGVTANAAIAGSTSRERLDASDIAAIPNGDAR